MKTRVLAVLLAVCMIASSCVLFASATDFKAASYYFGLDATKISDLDTTARSDYQVKVTPKEKPEISGGAESITKDNISQIYDFTPDYSVISKYISSVEGTLTKHDNGTATVSGVTITFSTGAKAWKPNTDLSNPAGSEKLDGTFAGTPISLASGISNVSNVKLTYKLYTVTTGIRISGDSYNNLVASEIAEVKMTVHRKNGSSDVKGKTTVLYVNAVKDLMDGDTVEFDTQLKNPTDEKYYKFNCWINGKGEVVGTSNHLEYTVTDDASFYAVYVEIVNRYRITFSSSGSGKMLVFPDGTAKTKTREVFEGDGQISVLQYKDFTFTLQPDEGWQVGKVIVTDESTGVSRNITSLVGLLTGETDWKTLIRATLTNTLGTNGTIKSESLGDPTYTFSNVDRDYSIDVTFIEQSPLVAAEGKELPTIAAEGLTLMSAEEAVSEAEAAKAAAGEGGTTVPAENGAAGGAAAASGSVVNPATGSTSGAVAVFAVLAVAAGAAFVSMKKKEN